MPGHFTHIYTARRVSDYLLSGNFPDWPVAIPELAHYTPQECGQAMRTWEKFTAIGAIGPDLFYFSQDYNSASNGVSLDVNRREEPEALGRVGPLSFVVRLDLG
jgi:hypothetical protein